MTHLNPCPFCHSVDVGFDDCNAYIHCHACEASGPWIDDDHAWADRGQQQREMAAAAWNRAGRVTLEDPDA